MVGTAVQGTTTQGHTEEVGIRHPSSPFTLQKIDGHRSGQAPILGPALLGGGSGHCDSRLDFSVTTLERSFSGGDRGPSHVTN